MRKPTRCIDESSRQDGYILLEIVCVLAIIGLLAAIILPAIPRATSRARLEGYAVATAAVLKADRVAALRLPAVYPFPEEAEEGGFVGYGPSIVQIFRDIMAQKLVKLLRGIKPADIPVEQPTHFELWINLKTANALGVTVPETLLARADKVIE